MEQKMKADVLEFFEESFRGDIFERELRLTEEQVIQLKENIPNIKIEWMSESRDPQKHWYHVKI